MLPKNEIQEASAGTGKTHALTNRYLKLLTAGIDPETILASTFTRKAAGEILDRIMSRLGAAAESNDAAARLSEQIGTPVNSQVARKLVRKLVVSLPRLQIGTLDSFFNRIARSFCFELGLPPTWDIVDPVRIQAVHDQAIEAIIGDQETVPLLRLLSQADAGRMVGETIASTVDTLFDVYRDSTAEAWSVLGNQRPVSDAEIDRLVEALNPGGDVALGLRKELEKLGERLRLGKWDEIAKMGLLHKVLDGETEYSRKPIPADVRRVLDDVVGACRRQICFNVASRTEATRLLLSHFAEHLHPLQLDLGELQFSDVTYLLARNLKLTPKQLIDRTGQRIEHLLLDEFQDTAPQQWAILKPFADFVTGPDAARTFFCVGDRKQAIYVWRGGAPRIFDAVNQDFGQRISKATPLIESRRSSPPIIDAVNRVFSAVNLRIASAENEFERRTFAQWAATFEQHTTIHIDEMGYVNVLRANSISNTEMTVGQASYEAVINDTVAEIESLYHRRPRSSIGVLLRTNDAIGDLAFRLHQLGIPTSEEAGNPLTDSAAVEVILSALTLADHPSNSVARFHLSHSPLGRFLGLEPETPSNQAFNSVQAQSIAARIRASLIKIGLGQTTRDWAIRLADVSNDRESFRLEQLVELAFGYDARWTARPRQFVEFVRQQRVLDPTSASVRLMTMHAAKGLEFETVVAPLFNLKSQWWNVSPTIVSRRRNPAGPIDAICRYVNKDEQRFLPAQLTAIFDDFSAQRVNEELCLLYVTMTRAERQLTIVVPPRSKVDQQNVVGVLLRGLNPESAETDRVVYQQGIADWISRQPIRGAGEATLPAQPTLGRTRIKMGAGPRTYRGVGWTRTSRRPANRLSPTARLHGGLGRRSAIQRGSLLHDCFRQLYWLEGGVNEEQLRASLRRVTPDIELIDRSLVEFRQILEQPWLRSLFVQADYIDQLLKRWPPDRSTLIEPLRLVVATERRFLFQQAGQMVEGIIDRLVVASEGNTPVWADVYEFKSGNLGDSSVEQITEFYAPQIIGYCEAVQRMWGLSNDRICGFLVLLDAGLIRQIPLV